MAKQKKRLRAQVTVGHDADGKPIYKWASGYTKKALAAAKEELRKTYIGGMEVQREILLGVYMQQWYATYKQTACSRRTGKPLSESAKSNLALAINNYIFPAFADRQMRSITAMELQQFVDTRLIGKGNTLIGDVCSALKTCFSSAYAAGIIDRDPTASLQKPKPEAAEPRRALTQAETVAVKALMDTTPDGLLLALLYYTGMRRGEALGLMWTDIDMRDKWIYVVRDIDPHRDCIDTVKTDYSKRSIPIPADLYELLRAARSIGNSFVVESPRTKSFWCAATFSRHWRSIRIKLHDIDPTIESKILVEKDGRKKGAQKIIGSILTPHYFRHSYASLLYNAGVDVLSAQRFLGHSDPTTTLRIYTHLADGKALLDAETVKTAFESAEPVGRRWQEIGKN